MCGRGVVEEGAKGGGEEMEADEGEARSAVAPIEVHDGVLVDGLLGDVARERGHDEDALWR